MAALLPTSFAPAGEAEAAAGRAAELEAELEQQKQLVRWFAVPHACPARSEQLAVPLAAQPCPAAAALQDRTVACLAFQFWC